MKQKNKNKKSGGKNGGNWRGVVQLVCWALLLTVIVGYASSYMTSTGHSASSVELEYSVFKQMAADGQVEHVDFDNEEAILLITPKDGYTYTAPDGTSYLKRTDERGKPVYSVFSDDGSRYVSDTSLSFFTVKIESNDAVIAFLDAEGGISYNQDYQPPTSFLTMLLINLLPFIIILLGMSLFMSWMAKKGGMGGMGGIGGVGKANAKVYMEKQTGVTFADVAGQD